MSSQKEEVPVHRASEVSEYSVRFRAPVIAGLIAGLIALMFVGCSRSLPDAQPDSLDLQDLLSERIQHFEKSPGVAMAVLGPSGTRHFLEGVTDLNQPTPVSARTFFEIGSITKIMTAILLTDMEMRGEVSLNDPIEKYLPEIDNPIASKITLLHLATHTSGLPKRADADDGSDDPYAHLAEDELLAFLSSFSTDHTIGDAGPYSNLGYGLLGVILSRAAGQSFEVLLSERITRPLGMGDTYVEFPEASELHQAVAHNSINQPISHWHFSAAYQAAGTVRSTLADLSRFAQAHIGMSDAPITGAIKRTYSVSYDTGGSDGRKRLMAWPPPIQSSRGEIYQYIGATGGSRCFFGFNPVTSEAVVMLWNSSNDLSDITYHLLDPSMQLEEQRKLVPISLDSSGVSAFPGKYNIGGDPVTIFLREDELFAQFEGESAYPVYPSSSTQLFYAVADAQLEFSDLQGGEFQLVELATPGKRTEGVREE